MGLCHSKQSVYNELENPIDNIVQCLEPRASVNKNLNDELDAMISDKKFISCKMILTSLKKLNKRFEINKNTLVNMLDICGLDPVDYWIFSNPDYYLVFLKYYLTDQYPYPLNENSVETIRIVITHNNNIEYIKKSIEFLGIVYSQYCRKTIMEGLNEKEIETELELVKKLITDFTNHIEKTDNNLELIKQYYNSNGLDYFLS